MTNIVMCGLLRTGSTTVTSMLHRLGFRNLKNQSEHMADAMADNWAGIVEKARWTGPYREMPCIGSVYFDTPIFWAADRMVKHLAETQPDTPVIAIRTTRDFESWIPSMQSIYRDGPEGQGGLRELAQNIGWMGGPRLDRDSLARCADESEANWERAQKYATRSGEVCVFGMNLKAQLGEILQMDVSHLEVPHQNPRNGNQAPGGMPIPMNQAARDMMAAATSPPAK